MAAITYEGTTEQTRQIVHRHTVLRRGLERRTGTVCDAAASGVPCQRQVAILRGYLDEEILTHADAEERTLYRAAATRPAPASWSVRSFTSTANWRTWQRQLRPGVDDAEAMHVQRLRAKVEQDPDNPRIVMTVRGVGYRAGSAS